MPRAGVLGTRRCTVRCSRAWIPKIPPGTVPDLSKAERQDPTLMRNSQISFPPSPLGSNWSDQGQGLNLKWRMRRLHINIFFFLKPRHIRPLNKHNSWFLDSIQVLLFNSVFPAVNWTVPCNKPSHLSVPSNEWRFSKGCLLESVQPHNTHTNIYTMHMLRLLSIYLYSHFFLLICWIGRFNPLNLCLSQCLWL